MAQKQRDLAVKTGKAVRNCLPDASNHEDDVTAEGMALVRERSAKDLAGKTFRSLYEPERVVSFS